MFGLSTTSAVTVLTFIGVLLSAAALVFLVLTARKRDWGNAAVASVMLLIATFGWIFGLQEGYVSAPGTSPKLEILDQIEESGLGRLYLAGVFVTNRGTAPARNCGIEIEHRYDTEQEYQYLGYASLGNEDLAAHGERRFWLARASYEGTHWEVRIIPSEIGDHVAQVGRLSFVGAGDHELKLTIIAENAESSPREFKLTVSEDEDKPPKLELLSEEPTQSKD